MPHDAYEAAPILEKLPLKIESIASFDDILLVGTKEGHLLQYKVKKSRGAAESKFDVSLERSNKSFSKKPITQLAAIPELYILISLSDNVVSVHDLNSFGQMSCISKTRGATLFAIDLEKPTSLSGDVQCTLRMSVAAKRKIQLFYWKNRNFLELKNDLSLYDIPRSMAWCKGSLCVGFKRDYFIIKVATGDLKELFPVGSRQLEPTVNRLGDDKLMLGRDEMSILIDGDGNPTQKYPLTWSEIPIALEYDPPYVIALLPKYIEIKTLEPRLTIQNIEFQKARLISQGSGHLYVASANHVWRMASMSISYQIRQVLQEKQFELALRLASMTDEPEEEKEKRIHNIKNLHAFDLFCKHRFEESMKIFAKLGTDPSHVIGLYPNLLPQEFRSQLDYPDTVPDMDGGELEKGIVALIEYLTQKRLEVLKDINKELTTMAIKEGNTTIKSKRQLSQIIDTTLLKCYIQTNDALVAPLLRLKDNNCHIEESERILRKNEKFSELIILYEKKGLHQKALNLLMKQAARPKSILKGHDRTIQYLQHLGSEHLNLIFEYSDWVLKEHPEDGLKIFTEDLPEVETLPRDKVLDYLEKIGKDLAIPYLEHIILQTFETSSDFHNRLVNLYREKVQTLMPDYLQSLPEGHSPHRAGHEPGDLGEYRGKLISFLQDSQYYVPERLLTRFPLDGFFEERAILLGRLGRHEQALGIYVHVLQDPKLAEEYCLNYYEKNKEGNRDVYVNLLKMYLQPPEPSLLGITPGQGTAPKANIPAALKLMEEQAWKIDTSKSLELLPTTTLVKDILTYLQNIMEQRATTRRRCQVLKSMLYAENLQVHEQRMFYEKEKVIITEERCCRVCKKRIGNSAFARYPNGVIVHYYCCRDPKECPVDK